MLPITVSYDILKTRCSLIKPYLEVKEDQIKEIRNIVIQWNHRINVYNINPLLYTIMNSPELIANYVDVRNIIFTKVNQLINHDYYLDKIDKDILKAIKEYFSWLKMRSDYVDTEEEMKVRIVSRTKSIKQELLDAYFHPDRCDRMLASYGDIWVDVHFDSE